jgi:hypothetical protein
MKAGDLSALACCTPEAALKTCALAGFAGDQFAFCTTTAGVYHQQEWNFSTGMLRYATARKPHYLSALLKLAVTTANLRIHRLLVPVCWLNSGVCPRRTSRYPKAGSAPA